MGGSFHSYGTVYQRVQLVIVIASEPIESHENRSLDPAEVGDAQRLRIRLHKVLRHQSSHRGLADQLQVIQGQPVLDLPVQW